MSAPTIAATASDDGWTDTAMSITNGSTDQPLTCQFLLAHWFEITVGPIAPGGHATQDLLVRRQTGDVAILNSVGDHMAVERLICGPTGADRSGWVDRSIDPIRQAVDAITLRCRLMDTLADCQFN